MFLFCLLRAYFFDIWHFGVSEKLRLVLTALSAFIVAKRWQEQGLMLIILRRKTLGDRLKLEEKLGTLNVSDTTVGSKQATFRLKKVSYIYICNFLLFYYFSFKIIHK